MLTLYRILLYLALPWLLLRLLLRGLGNRSYCSRIGERFGFSDPETEDGGIWIHAVSVGEVNAAAPLVKAIRGKLPDASITITTMTTTGSERVARLFGDTVSHCYLPYDYPGAVQRFLVRVRPSLGLVMETEIWPNLIHACQANYIRLIYANVRMSDRSYKSYRRFQTLVSQTLAKVEHFAVQSEPDADRLIRLGASEDCVSVTGSIKFDINMPPSTHEAGLAIRRQLGAHRPVWIAASTHDGEEEIALDVHKAVCQQLDQTLLVLAPRHPERFSQVKRLCEKNGIASVKWTELSGHLDADNKVLVVDAMGQLTQFLAASDVVFMAGSFVPVGGHNILEPAALSRAIVFGPHMFNFEEISRMFLKQGAASQVHNSGKLAEEVLRLLQEPAARDSMGQNGERLMSNNRGVIDRLMSIIDL